MFIDVTYCFIYLYFFSGSIPHFPFLYACPRSSHFCCPFHSQGHCNRQCPLALGPLHVAFRVCCLGIRVCVCLGCSGTEVILATACTQSPSLLCGQALISSVHLSGFRGTPTCLHSNTLPRSTSGLPQNEDNPLSSCWAFLFRIGLQWKGGLLILRKHNRRPRLSLPLSARPPHQHTEKSWETARIHKSKIPSPPFYP